MERVLLYKIAFISLILLNTACGSNGINWVKDAEINSYQKDGDIYGELTTFLDTGGMLLPSVELPILNPRDSLNPIGLFSMRNSLNGSSSELSISINLSEAAGVPNLGLSTTLPNGSPIPVAGVNQQSVVMFQVGNSDSRIYLSIDTQSQQAMLGVAVPIEQFSSIGSKLGGVNVFPAFNLNNGMVGTFGIFTGSGAKQNGFALFIDVSGLLSNGLNLNGLAQNGNNQSFGGSGISFDPTQLLSTLIVAGINSQLGSSKLDTSQPEVTSQKTLALLETENETLLRGEFIEVEYLDITTTKANEDVIGGRLYQLMKQRTQLKLQ